MTNPMNENIIKSDYEKNGHVILPGALSEKTMQYLRDTIAGFFRAHSKPGEDVHATCIRLDKEDKELLFRLYQILPKTVAMDMIKLEALPFVRMLYPEGMVADIGSGILFGLPNDKRLVWTWHQECTYHPGMEKIVHFWFPIFGPNSKANGTMSSLLGSHKLGALPYDTHKPFENGGTSLIPKNIDKYTKEYEHFYFNAKPGDLAILDKFTIHTSNPNTTEQVRFTGVLRMAVLEKIPDRTDFSKIESQK